MAVMPFTLIGNDRLSPVLRGAGRAAVGLTRRLDSVGLGASGLTKVAGAGASAAVAVGKVGLAAGAAVPVVTGLVSTLLEVGPAAGVAATGVVAVGLAAGALKLGLLGVGEAVTTAFDPASAEAHAEAMKKLAPPAREFVRALQDLKPAFDSVQQAVQRRLFKDLGPTLRTTAKAVRDDLGRALGDSATSLNLMGRQVLNTATGLSKSGALGKALDSATDGLRNMVPLPATLVQGLVQVGAAAGPSFERLTASAGGALEGLSQRMTAAFESGRMQEAIEGAISLIGDLGEVGGNVATTIGNIFGAAGQSSTGFVSALQEVTGALAEVTASPAVQGGLAALASVMAQLGVSAAPLLTTALTTIGLVFQELGPPVERFIRALGEALAPVLERVSPLLVGAAERLGGLLDSVTPLLPGLDGLIGLLGGELAPVVEAVGPLLVALGGSLGQVGGAVGPLLPVARDLIAALAEGLTPVAEALGPLLATAADTIGMVATAITPVLPVVGELVAAFGQGLQPIVAALGPVLSEVVGIIGVLAQAITPLLPIVGSLIAQLGPALTPVLSTAGDLIAQLAPVVQQVAGVLAGALQPVLTALPGSLQPILAAVSRLATELMPLWQDLIIELSPTLTTLGKSLGELLAALGPVIGAWISFQADALEMVMPLLRTGVRLVGRLAEALSGDLTATLNDVVIPALGMVAALLKGDFSGAFDKAKQVVKGVVRTMVRQFTALPRLAWEGLSELGSKVWARVRDAGGRMVRAAKDKIGDTVDKIRALPGKAWRALSGLGSKLWERMRNAGRRLVRTARSKIGDAVDVIKKLPKRAKNALGNLKETLVEKGKDLIRGLWNGITSMGDWLKDKITGWVDSVIPDPIGKALGIESPSRVMRDRIGRQIPAGIIAGIRDGAPAVDHTMRGLVTVPALPPVGLARRLGAGAAAGAGRRPGGHEGGTVINVNVDARGAMDPVAVGQEIRKVLLRLKRDFGVNVQLGTG